MMLLWCEMRACDGQTAEKAQAKAIGHEEDYRQAKEDYRGGVHGHPLHVRLHVRLKDEEAKGN